MIEVEQYGEQDAKRQCQKHITNGYILPEGNTASKMDKSCEKHYAKWGAEIFHKFAEKRVNVVRLSAKKVSSKAKQGHHEGHDYRCETARIVSDCELVCQNLDSFLDIDDINEQTERDTAVFGDIAHEINAVGDGHQEM
ncbi:hypothetical protein OGATHE_005535 [Ogataea polymorpha]|uniref:Uncharacterized protein n=1 Tax=Ogataea polymorpha TaxID=460523 RepID=A0A9P8NTK6_9ASCO|nr:hypothetical protein OGATHE_005535 [Ogataea polymorpha]